MIETVWMEPAARSIVPALRDCLERVWPMSHVRSLAAQQCGLDTSLLTSPSHRDWFLLTNDRSLPDAVVIAREWGRALCPASLIDLNVVTRTLDTDPEHGRLASAVRQGEHLVAWSPTGVARHWGRQAGVQATAHSDGLRLTGATGVTQGVRQADSVLLRVRDGEGLTQLLVPIGSPGVRIEPLQSLDLTRDLGAVHFDDVVVDHSSVVGVRADSADVAERQDELALILSAAATVGAMAELFEQALSDAKSRTAFGRPIGSFQAVKHQLVDAGLALEMSQGLVNVAADAVASGALDAQEIVSMAKAYVGRAGIDLAHTVWQVLGGKAYMWDSDFHFYLRRITVDASLHGDIDWHERLIWSKHAPEDGADG
jgi:alkylation response protein AidB-like acyl-CoA dehydrogenase